MRALRVVGLTEDGEVVLEDPVRLERYTVPADERLRAAARGDLSRLGQIAIELESQLRPREIQARIRAGASVEQVATAAGVPEQKIERFAYPVLTERFRTADNAQRAHPMRADGPDNRTLAEVVAHTLGLRGQTYEGAKWDSWKGEDGRWVVALSWRAGRSDNRAHWVFQPGAHGGTVTALDEHASDLVEGLPARPLRTVGAVVDMTRPEEEPPPAHSPVEQWRAAASDSFREQRLPMAPDAGRRTPSEPWRPAPSQRQAEPPADPRPGRQDPYRQAESLADPRPAAYRPTEPLADPRPADRPEAYRPAEPLADPRPARPDSYQPEAYPPGHPFPTPRAGGAARKRGADVRGVGAVGARRHPDRGAARARWRRDGAGGPDRTGRAGGGRRDAAPGGAGDPGADGGEGPGRRAGGSEPTVDVAEAPAEAPAAVIADAPAAGRSRRRPSRPRSWTRRLRQSRPRPSRRPPSRPRPERRPPSPPQRSREADEAAQRRAGCSRTIWIRTIRSHGSSRTIWIRTIRNRAGSGRTVRHRTVRSRTVATEPSGAAAATDADAPEAPTTAPRRS